MRQHISDFLMVVFGYQENEKDYSWEEIGGIFMLIMVPLTVIVAIWVYATYFWQP